MGRISKNAPAPSTVRSRMSRKIQKIREERQKLINMRLEQDENESGDPESSFEEDSSLKEKLQHWANSFRISKRAVDSLLNILVSSGIDCLPKNHRTLLKTPTNVEIRNLAGGNFWFNGLEKCLEQVFSSLDRDLAIGLNFNIDGLPLYNSSNICFYPILASIHGMPNIPTMVVAIWCGEGKPNGLNHFLRRFLNELKHLLQNDFIINNRRITLHVRCFICDTPARAFIKGKT